MWCSAVGCIVLLTLSLLVAPLLTAAQPVEQVRRIGILRAAGASPEAERNFEAFRHALRDLGWVEGQNLAMEYRPAEGQVERLPALAAELVQLKVEVIVTLGGNAVTRVVQAATSTIPIVMVSTSDPVGQGFIASLAHPGGNITGTASLSIELAGKWTELLKEAVPQVSRMAVLLNRTNPQAVDQLRMAQVAAQVLGVELLILEPHSPDEFESVFAAMLQAGAGALLVLPDTFLLQRHGPTITARPWRCSTGCPPCTPSACM